jgi:Cu(I)/Ag(I) efflux system membrane fusion protein
MKNLFQNKYFLIGITLLGGILIGWVLKPSSGSSGDMADHDHTVDENGVWTCSMHPQIRQNEPGSCPICGMALIPLEDDSGGEDALAIKMSNTAMQLANIVTKQVSKGNPTKEITMTGKVIEDERRVTSQSSHIPGRIESLNVNFTGDYVRKGQTIGTVYSPTLVTAQQELFEAQKIKDTQPSLFDAAKRKLANWKLTDRQIDEILAGDEPLTTLPILAETSGYVKEKMVNEGDYIKQGAPLYTLSNLSRVWILFEAYETDLQWVNIGSQIEFAVASIPGKTFNGEVTYIDPVINPNTRVAKVRLELSNTDKLLKPEMFVSGKLKAGSKGEEALIVPKSAIMWTGKRSVVYVKSATEHGVSFRMREVTLGSAYGDNYIIEKGLEDGEEIAVNGTFSIDAAAQLAGKPSMMSPEGGMPNTGHSHHRDMQMDRGSMESESNHPEVNISTEKFESTSVFKAQLQNVFQAYLPLKDALIETNAKTAKEKAQPLLAAINNVDMKEVKGEAHMEWMKDLDVLMKTTEYITQESDVGKIRGALSPLSDQLYQTILKFEVETGGYRQYCPMAFNNTGGFWLSDSDKVLNPYFGDVMLTCGNVEEELK